MFRRQQEIVSSLYFLGSKRYSPLCIQETRHIVAAITQQITYNEFLPMVLGKEVMSQHDLILLKEGYFDGYDRYQRERRAEVWRWQVVIFAGERVAGPVSDVW